MYRPILTPLPAFLVFSFLVFSGTTTEAAISTATWVGTGGNEQWSNADNWSIPGLPQAVPNNNLNRAFRVLIDNDRAADVRVNLSATQTISDLTIDEDDTLSIESGVSLAVETAALGAGGGIQNSGLIIIDGSNPIPGIKR